jgi:hypothetical protein
MSGGDCSGLTLDCNGPETHPLDFNFVLRGLADIAFAVPDLTIICDHCGGLGKIIFRRTLLGAM